jgi:hypothetical protein
MRELSGLLRAQPVLMSPLFLLSHVDIEAHWSWTPVLNINISALVTEGTSINWVHLSQPMEDVALLATLIFIDRSHCR